LFGGLLMNCIFALLVCNFFQISYLLILVFCIGGLLAFFGDLLISFHKRENNIKDTGNFLPGHGGVLDRMDSHLLATPVILVLSIFLSS
jgi:phosphatidate cytidylyltransferase